MCFFDHSRTKPLLLLLKKIYLQRAFNWFFFFFFEFLKNISKAFLLNNGSSYYYAHLFSLSEFIITQILSSSNPKPSQAWMPLIGLMLIIIGQSIRTLSMMTAAQSFNHQVSTHPHPQADHVLIINGIYSYLRHPAYFGFFWWSIGLQIYLNNRASLLIFTIILWKFFNHRIQGQMDCFFLFFIHSSWKFI